MARGDPILAVELTSSVEDPLASFVRARALVPELEPSPTDDMHLVLLMKDIRRALR